MEVCAALIGSPKDREGDMAPETLKVLLLIALFASLEGALHFSWIGQQCRHRLRQAAGLLWPLAGRTHYMLQPARIRRVRRRH